MLERLSLKIKEMERTNQTQGFFHDQCPWDELTCWPKKWKQKGQVKKQITFLPFLILSLHLANTKVAFKTYDFFFYLDTLNPKYSEI